MKVPFLDINAQNAPLRREFSAAIEQVIDTGAFAGGPFVEQFEEDFAKFCGCHHAIGVGNGTDALWAALLAFGVGPGDEVVTVPSTFMATAEAITYCRARPVFVDVDERTYTMDPSRLDKAITKKTRAIIPVHLFGQTADMDPILEIARAHKLPVIEDAAQAHGAEYKGRRAGSLADAGCFSFYPGKNLGAFGEAGAVVTDNEELQRKIRVFRDHGQTRKYHHTMVGWNCRMDAIQGACLAIKLRHLDRGNELRRTHAARYDGAFKEVEEIIPPLEAEYARHVYHVYALRVQDRDEVLRQLERKGIGCGVHYPVPVHLQQAYVSLGHQRGAFPVSEQIANEFLSLPMFPELTEAQIEFVIETVTETISAGAIA